MAKSIKKNKSSLKKGLGFSKRNFVFSVLALALVGGFFIYRSFAATSGQIVRTVNSKTDTTASVTFALKGVSKTAKADTYYISKPGTGTRTQLKPTAGNSLTYDMAGLGCGPNTYEVSVWYYDSAKRKKAKEPVGRPYIITKPFAVATTCRDKLLTDDSVTNIGMFLSGKILGVKGDIASIQYTVSASHPMGMKKMEKYSFGWKPMNLEAELFTTKKSVTANYSCAEYTAVAKDDFRRGRPITPIIARVYGKDFPNVSVKYGTSEPIYLLDACGTNAQ